jgi:hypothetical protein
MFRGHLTRGGGGGAQNPNPHHFFKKKRPGATAISGTHRSLNVELGRVHLYTHAHPWNVCLFACFLYMYLSKYCEILSHLKLDLVSEMKLTMRVELF